MYLYASDAIMYEIQLQQGTACTCAHMDLRGNCLVTGYVGKHLALICNQWFAYLSTIS